MTEIAELPDGRYASYHVAGSGIPALMFLEPAAGCVPLRQHSALFPAVLRTYLVDLPGAAAPEEQARCYEEVRDAVGLGRVTVFGHWSGAAAALAYAAMYPERTAACVAVAPAADARTATLTAAGKGRSQPDGAGRRAAAPRHDRDSCRTLIVSGELDVTGGPAQARQIAQGIPGSEVVVLPGCGHLPAIEAPAEYRQVVLDFLRGQC